jgi:hypothetical protein
MSVISFLHPFEAKPFLDYLGLKALRRPRQPDFQARINPSNGTPKAMPATTGMCAISIEVFYKGIEMF